MIKMKRILLSLLISLMVCSCVTQNSFTIITKTGIEREEKTKNQLLRLLKTYDLSKWTFTRKIAIEHRSIPHSHPELTVNTYFLDDDVKILSIYLHEQIHWHLYNNLISTNLAIKKLKQIYRNAPIRLPEGSGTERSTYLHLIVNYLEYKAMQDLVGREKAKETIEAFSNKYYRWIYRTVLSDESEIAKIVEMYDLDI